MNLLQHLAQLVSTPVKAGVTDVSHGLTGLHMLLYGQNGQRTPSQRISAPQTLGAGYLQNYHPGFVVNNGAQQLPTKLPSIPTHSSIFNNGGWQFNGVPMGAGNPVQFDTKTYDPTLAPQDILGRTYGGNSVYSPVVHSSVPLNTPIGILA